MTQELTAGRRIPPGPRANSMLGKLMEVANDRLGLMSSLAKRYGDAVRMPVGPKSLYFFNHPDHAKYILADNAPNYRKGWGLMHARRALGDGLLTSEGELWRKQRKVIQPAFHRDRMADWADAIADEGMAMAARLRATGQHKPVNVVAAMTELTLGVLGRTLLDTDLSIYQNIAHSFEAIQDQAMFEMVTLNLVPIWVPLPQQRRFRRAKQALLSIVDEMMSRRAAEGGRGGDDLLTRLADANRSEPDERIRRQRMRDELVTLLLAGHETTASTLGWTFHLLDRHPEVQDRLRHEVREVLGDRRPAFEDLNRLTYTAQVIEEVMRLYPPVWILSRQAIEDDEVGGYFVPKGMNVLVVPYTLHRHPEFWPDPERFDPDRFGPQRVGERPRYAYLPFGAGPRFCVGNNLGMMEATFVTAIIVREMRLRAAPGFRPKPEPMLTLRLRDGLPMTVQPVAD
jgi:enediyne biosynthesis protein E7